jgi:hypothetical protein
MSKKVIVIFFAATFLSSPVYAGKRIKIYDENSRYKGYVEDGKIYDSGSHYKGHIEKSGKFYDENSRYKGHFEKDRGGKKSQRSHYKSDYEEDDH